MDLLTCPHAVPHLLTAAHAWVGSILLKVNTSSPEHIPLGISQICEAMYKRHKGHCALKDKNTVIAVSGTRRSGKTSIVAECLEEILQRHPHSDETLQKLQVALDVMRYFTQTTSGSSMATCSTLLYISQCNEVIGTEISVTCCYPDKLTDMRPLHPDHTPHDVDKQLALCGIPLEERMDSLWPSVAAIVSASKTGTLKPAARRFLGISESVTVNESMLYILYNTIVQWVLLQVNRHTAPQGYEGTLKEVHVIDTHALGHGVNYAHSRASRALEAQYLYSVFAKESEEAKADGLEGGCPQDMPCIAAEDADEQQYEKWASTNCVLSVLRPPSSGVDSLLAPLADATWKYIRCLSGADLAYEAEILHVVPTIRHLRDTLPIRVEKKKFSERYAPSVYGVIESTGSRCTLRSTHAVGHKMVWLSHDVFGALEDLRMRCVRLVAAAACVSVIKGVTKLRHAQRRQAEPAPVLCRNRSQHREQAAAFKVIQWQVKKKFPSPGAPSTVPTIVALQELRGSR